MNFEHTRSLVHSLGAVEALAHLRRAGLTDEEILTAVLHVLSNLEECEAVAWFLQVGYKYAIEEARGGWHRRFALAMSSQFVPFDRKLPNEELPIQRLRRPPKPTFIYLMRNNRNGYHKIGRSTDPKYRESTLQSEEPDVVLVVHWPGGEENESRLHERFASKRIRGEWFNLSQEDVDALCAEATGGAQ